MNKYGEVALMAVESLHSGNISSPVEAWEIAAR